MKRILFLLFLGTVGGPLFAQTVPGLRIVAEQVGKNVVFRVAEKSYPGSETVFLTLDRVENCSTTPGTRTFTVRSDGQTLLTLQPVNEAYGVVYGYSYRFVEGLVDPPVDTTFVYRMPCSTLAPVRVGAMWNVYDIDKRLENRKLLGYYFYLSEGDTVYAARRGIVTQVERRRRPGPDDAGVSFTTETSKIVVEHPDGSFARYTSLDGDRLFVGEGDEVFPSTPLALAGSYDGSGYQVCLQLFWLTPNPDAAQRQRMRYVWRHFFPPFATTEGVVVPVSGRSYTPLATRELLTREMSRKELKRLNPSGRNR